MMHKTYVPRHSCIIVIWWSYLTWPWPLLSTRPILICHQLHPLGNLLEKFGFVAVRNPVSAADKAKSDYFYPWPDLDLTCDFLCKFLKLSWKLLLESFWLPPISLRPLFRELAWGGDIYPPLSQRGRLETPTLRGLSEILFFISSMVIIATIHKITNRSILLSGAAWNQIKVSSQFNLTSPWFLTGKRATTR